jgi:hypothetical protein
MVSRTTSQRGSLTVLLLLFLDFAMISVLSVHGFSVDIIAHISPDAKEK